MSNFTEKLNKLEAKREAVEALLGLAEDERPNWFDEMPERQKYAMYKNYDTDKLIRQQELLYEEYNNLLRLMPAPAPGKLVDSSLLIRFYSGCNVI